MRGTGGQLETYNKNNHESVETPDRTPVFHTSAQHPFTNQCYGTDTNNNSTCMVTKVVCGCIT